jgi:single-strand DNA-binding protein
LSSGYGDKRKTTWINCSLIGKRAESLAPMLLKGTQVGVNGEISLNEYIAKDGTNKSSIELNVSNVTLLGKKDTTKVAKPDTSSDIDVMEDDIPF